MKILKRFRSFGQKLWCWKDSLNVIVVFLTAVTLTVAIISLNLDRGIREATMLGLVSDLLYRVREADSREDKVARNNFGQNRILETMNEASVSLQGLNLSRINLRRVVLPKANMTDADLSCSNLTRAVIPDAILVGAELKATQFLRTELDGVDFTDAELESAKFIRIENMQGVRFTNANLSGTLFRSVDTSGAIDLTYEQVREACRGKDPVILTLSDGRKVPLEKCTKDQKFDQKCRPEDTMLKTNYLILRDIENSLDKILEKVEQKKRL